MIADNILRIKQEIGQNVTLVVVSKFREISEIQAVYGCGQRVFAENRVQALLERYEALPKDISWHLIGHLQTNKVKQIIGFIDTIQSVDSLHLAEEISKQAVKAGRTVNCMLQIKLSEEETKSGFDFDEMHQLLSQQALQLPGISWIGVMGMAELSDNYERIGGQFDTLRNYFEKLKQDIFPGNPEFKDISMGMSGDYKLAVSKGSTMVRIGSAVFA